ncbi:MAG: pyridoxal phosphate-dependent aminotransferase [Myxococcales bacterium]|nr:pyridoxal phosphate-dependent aminotransferase [Myxococcales bacterium]MCB9533452.1 pyridoxal phosphate-dependent aminotransferase [Myxococcales bacterium]
MKISRFVAAIPGSATLAISAKASKMKADGIDVISFSAGEPDFITPEPILEAARVAMAKGATKYTPVGGSAGLKAAVRRYISRRVGVEYGDKEIIASCGAKHSLYNIFFTLLDPGDEVLIPAPFWVSYPTQVEMAGGVPVTVPGLASDEFVPSIDALEAAVTDRTTAIILNNPSNPTGAFWSADQLRAIAAWLDRHPGITVVSDSIYDELVYDGREATELLAIAPHLRDRYVLVNGFSKAFAMTGWRLGYACGPAPFVAAMENLQSQSTSNPNSVAQAAGIAALDLGDAVIAPMRASFQRRRDLIYGLLSDIPGLEVVKPQGAFYIFPDATPLLGKRAGDRVIADDMVLAEYLLEDARVAVVPGTPFGAPGFFRLSYACSDAEITEGCARIAASLAKLA